MSCTDKMYLTGNEICSDNPRDLSDNARVFDAYVNSAEFSVTDRFGIERVTLAWVKWRVDNAIDEATGEIKAEWQTGVTNINSEETNALNNINTTTAASLDSINTLTSSATSDISTLRDSSLASIEEAKDNAIEEIIETSGTTIVQEPGQDINKVMSQKAVTDFVTEEISNIVIPEPVNVVNETGDSEVDAISQKAFTDMSFGIGQEWVDVSSERSGGVNYINNEDFALYISIFRSPSNSNYTLDILVDDIIVSSISQGGQNTGTRAGTAQVVIMPGSTYRAVGTISKWLELR